MSFPFSILPVHFAAIRIASQKNVLLPNIIFFLCFRSTSFASRTLTVDVRAAFVGVLPKAKCSILCFKSPAISAFGSSKNPSNFLLLTSLIPLLLIFLPSSHSPIHTCYARQCIKRAPFSSVRFES